MCTPLLLFLRSLSSTNVALFYNNTVSRLVLESVSCLGAKIAGALGPAVGPLFGNAVQFP